MTITVSVPDQFAQQARTEGLSVESYIERLLASEARRREQPKWIRFGPGPLTPQEAGRIRNATLVLRRRKNSIHGGFAGPRNGR